MIGVFAGARRLAHTELARSDRALHALLGVSAGREQTRRAGCSAGSRREPSRVSGDHCGLDVDRSGERLFAGSGFDGVSAGGTVINRCWRCGRSPGAVARRVENPVRARHSGFFEDALLTFLEQRALAYLVVARNHPRRQGGRGRKLIDVPGYTFRIWVTNRTDEPLALWRDDSGRATIEQRIKELKNDLAADGFCTQNFWATAAAFLAVLFTFNLLSGYQQTATPNAAEVGFDYKTHSTYRMTLTSENDANPVFRAE